MTDELDLDALVEEAWSKAGPQGSGFPDDYVTSTKKEGDLTPEGRHDVTIAHVGSYGTTPWGTESLSFILKMDSNGRGWWDSLDFVVADNHERSQASVRASMKKLLALGFPKSEVVNLVRNRGQVDWPKLLKGRRLNVTVKHSPSANGHTYANTYFNEERREPEVPAPPTANPAPAPAGQGTPLPSGLPTLGT